MFSHLIKLWGTFSTPPAMCIYSPPSLHVKTGVTAEWENYSRCPCYCNPQSFGNICLSQKRGSRMCFMYTERQKVGREKSVRRNAGCFRWQHVSLVYFRGGSPVHGSSSSFIEDHACPGRSSEMTQNCVLSTVLFWLSLLVFVTSFVTVCKYTCINILQEVLTVM